MAEGINQVLAAFGETDCLFHKRLGAVVKANLSCFHQGSDGMGAGFLAPSRGDWQHPRYAAPEGLQHSRAVGGVLNQHGIGPQALLFQRLQTAQQKADHLRQAKAVPSSPEHLHLQGSAVRRPLGFACAWVERSRWWCQQAHQAEAAVVAFCLPLEAQVTGEDQQRVLPLAASGRSCRLARKGRPDPQLRRKIDPDAGLGRC